MTDAVGVPRGPECGNPYAFDPYEAVPTTPPDYQLDAQGNCVETRLEPYWWVPGRPLPEHEYFVPLQRRER